MTTLSPATEEEACETVAAAAGRRTPLSIVGGGTKQQLGRPAQTEATLSSRGLTGITLHEPQELVLSARAGTPFADVERRLAASGQELAFEPMDWRVLLQSAGERTVGGIVATNTSGPRRIQAGACRDSLIGVRLVNGRGEAVKSGGRVMKNVTGLDLVKLLAGSYGTLGLLTEVTFKVTPLPERIATLALAGLDDARAVAALAAALGSPFEVTGAAHLSAGALRSTRTVVRIGGFESSVRYRIDELRRHLADFGSAELMEDEEAAALWRDVRDAVPVAEPRGRAVWRISTAPSRAPGMVAAIARELDARWFYDWGGGLVWLAVPADETAGAGVVRGAVAKAGGHATLVRAPAEIRATVPVFHPLPDPPMQLTRGIKAAFDPCAIFEAGRMYPGI